MTRVSSGGIRSRASLTSSSNASRVISSTGPLSRTNAGSGARSGPEGGDQGGRTFQLLALAAQIQRGQAGDEVPGAGADVPLQAFGHAVRGACDDGLDLLQFRQGHAVGG